MGFLGWFQQSMLLLSIGTIHRYLRHLGLRWWWPLGMQQELDFMLVSFRSNGNLVHLTLQGRAFIKIQAPSKQIKGSIWFYYLQMCTCGSFLGLTDHPNWMNTHWQKWWRNCSRITKNGASTWIRKVAFGYPAPESTRRPTSVCMLLALGWFLALNSLLDDAREWQVGCMPGQAHQQFSWALHPSER